MAARKVAAKALSKTWHRKHGPEWDIGAKIKLWFSCESMMISQ